MKKIKRPSFFAVQSNCRTVLITGLGAVLLSLFFSVQTCADTLVVPNTLATTEGQTAYNIPFGLSSSISTGSRYQQVYNASEFAALPGPVLITRIAFRPDQYQTAFSGTLSDVQVNLSTTSVSRDTLTNIFANNVGLDDTVVFHDPLTLTSATGVVSTGPKDFEIEIVLTTPFFYDRSRGNLLLDVRNATAPAALNYVYFDAQFSLTTVSRTYSYESSGDPLASPSGVLGTGQGLVTRFTYEEPGLIVCISDPLTLERCQLNVDNGEWSYTNCDGDTAFGVVQRVSNTENGLKAEDKQDQWLFKLVGDYNKAQGKCEHKNDGVSVFKFTGDLTIGSCTCP